jgi:diacylglycerol kinase family enzyme
MTKLTAEPDRIRVVEPPRRYAVLLNAKAKAWTGEVHQAVIRFVPPRDLYLTDTFAQAQKSIDKILNQGYDAVFAGGGDGTIVYLINAIEERIQSGRLSREDAPLVGVLRLGTGNAIAAYVGAGPIIEDLRTLSAGAPLKVHQVNLIEDGTNRFPFAGFGWDADIVNDYDELKDAVRETAWENYATGLGGYFASVLSRTVPRAAKTGATRIAITNQGETAYRLDEHGHIVREYVKGDVLFEGPIKICSVASIPFWGFKIRMFPYCNLRPGFFELRMYDGSIAYLLSHLHKFWAGDIDPNHLNDFLVTDVHVEIIDREMSYQVSGDAAGYRSEARWRIAEHPAQLAVPLQ